MCSIEAAQQAHVHRTQNAGQPLSGADSLVPIGQLSGTTSELRPLASDMSMASTAAMIGIIGVIGAPQNLNVYCSFAEPRSKLGSKRLSSSDRTHPRFNTRKTSLPGRRIQRKRL